MIPNTTPVHTILQRRAECIAWDNTTLEYLGDGMNLGCFKARVLTSTRAPEDIGKVCNEYARDLWDATGECCGATSLAEGDPKGGADAPATKPETAREHQAPPAQQFELLI